MSYKALITNLKNVRPHPNADRVQLATCWGSQVVIGLDNIEGEKGIYFPTDGQLSEEFCKENNLFRKNEMNKDTNKSGFFSEKRRVRTQKFRGEISDGFWIPIKALAYTGANLETLKHGEEYDAINGKEFCTKYINPNTLNKAKSSSKVNKKSEKLQAPMFKRHYDTAHFVRKLEQFQEDDYIEITEKLHGTCMLPTQRVLMADGSYKKISSIKEGDFVLGYDHDLKYTRPSKVIKTWNHGANKDTWQQITYSRKGLKGNHYGSFYCTKEHEVYTKEGYKEAQKIKKGHELLIVRTDYELNEYQKQILIGKFLGDGSITFRDHGFAAKMTFGHCEDQKRYLKDTLSNLGNIAYLENNTYESGFGSKMYRGHTKDMAFLVKYFSKHYKNGKKCLDKSIIKDINPLALAYLYMDDGSIGYSDEVQNHTVNFALNSFKEETIKIIQEALKKYNINSTRYKSKGWRIRLNSKASEKFFTLVAPYICESMQYKLPKALRGQKPFKFYNTDLFTSYIFTEKVIDSVDTGKLKIGKTGTKRDITTETGNFFAGEALVHNSGRSGLVQIHDPKKSFIQKIMEKLGYTPKAKWALVNGSRRVDFLPNKKHGTNPFHDPTMREKAGELFKDLLHKGETVYYEIVGYEPSGALIMGGGDNKKLGKEYVKLYGDRTEWTYGCAPGEFDVYVYRMTLTNEEGLSAEYSWNKVKERCSEMGIKHVPELWRGTLSQLTDFSANREAFEDDLVKAVDLLSEGQSTVTPTHMREGICVRINDRAYKHKSNVFKILEGIIKDSGAEDLEEAS